MNPGRLNQVGCLNIAALQTLIREQEMRYDFGYYPVTYDTNIPVLILSEGKSLLEVFIYCIIFGLNKNSDFYFNNIFSLPTG